MFFFLKDVKGKTDMLNLKQSCYLFKICFQKNCEAESANVHFNLGPCHKPRASIEEIGTNVANLNDKEI